MEKFGLMVRLEAKPGKEKELMEFLKSNLGLAKDEPGTIKWYAFQIGPSSFGIFDTFEHISSRQDHLTGLIAIALQANAPELLATDPVLEKIELLAVK